MIAERPLSMLAAPALAVSLLLGFGISLITVAWPVPGLLLGMSLCGLLSVVRWPSLLLLGFVVSLALPVQRTLAGLPLNTADGIVLLWCLLLPGLLLRRNARLHLPVLVKAVLPFVLAVALAQATSIAWQGSLKQLLRIVEWFVVLPLLLLVFTPDPRFWRFVAVLLLVVPSLFALDGLIEWARDGQRLTEMLGIGVPVPDGDQAQIRHTFDISGRAGSTFGGAQGLAMFLVMTMSVSIAHLLRAATVWLRRLAGVSLLISLAGLAATQSRGGLLGAVTVATVMLLMLKPAWRAPLLWLATLTVVAGVMVLGFLPGWDGSLSGLVPGRQAAVQDRLILWGVVWQVFAEHPLLGVGLGNFRDAFFAHPVALNVELGYPSLHAHNTFLEILAGTGALGLLAYLWFLWSVGRALLRRWSPADPGEANLFTLAAIGTLSAYLVFAMVDMLLLQNMHFLLVLLLSLGLLQQAEASDGLARTSTAEGGSP
ncbi:MAG: O-antigen ligase family protein [Pseudomonas sp.]|uniref:O-antigen ligase family protein n=1 Tax=Pseudomonas sp. TaxID=306 RepID=UPI0033960D2D